MAPKHIKRSISVLDTIDYCTFALQQKEVLEKGNRVINYSTQMKKLISFIAFAMMAVFSLSLVSCGDDNDNDDEPSSSALVGTWDIVSNIYYSPDAPPEEDNVRGAYWVFSETQITVHDVEDLLNGKSVDYVYDSSTKSLKVVGWPVYSILELTKTTLKMESVHIMGTYNVITLKKR